MAEQDRSRMVDEFCKVTGVDRSRAALYLEQADWDCNLAMSNFYEEDEDDTDPEPDVPPNLGSSPPVISQAASSRFVTMSSLMNKQDHSSDEEGQAFYAGGSDRSGQQVLGPGKRKGHHIVQDVFKAVKSRGAEVVGPPDKRRSTTKLKAFGGTGHVLGSTDTTSSSDVVENSEEENSAAPPVEVVLKMWRTGLTVDDGEFRDYNDPEMKEFLRSIQEGEVPAELRRQANGGVVHVNIEDHSHEDYAPKKPIIKAFTGTGFRLGSITPPVVNPNSAEMCEKNESEAQKIIKVNDARPVTSIQIRLADGSRLQMRANPTHTIGDVRTYIVRARPEYGASVFSLMTAYPSKELTDDNATLESENLLNAVIVQKLK